MGSKHGRILVALLIVMISPVMQMYGVENVVYLNTVMKNQAFDNNLGAIFHQRQIADESHRIMIHLPALMVYDPSGTLIYYGSDPGQNAAFLKRLPQSASGHEKADGLLQEDEIFMAVPEFAKARSVIQSSHRYLVFAMTQFPSNLMCAPQDNAVREIGQKGSAMKIDVLQVALDVRG
jgi:hypothetical protein